MGLKRRRAAAASRVTGGESQQQRVDEAMNRIRYSGDLEWETHTPGGSGWIRARRGMAGSNRYWATAHFDDAGAESVTLSMQFHFQDGPGRLWRTFVSATSPDGPGINAVRLRGHQHRWALDILLPLLDKDRQAATANGQRTPSVHEMLL